MAGSCDCLSDLAFAMQLFLSKLKKVMERTPPPEPSSAAINLMIGVGNFQVLLLYT